MDNSTEFDLPSIEARIREKWEKEGAHQPKLDKKKTKKFVSAAFPYPNSPQHIGHGRTYTTTDIHARYLRLKGYNVLFPMGFHVTGTPIIAMAKRIADHDREVYDVFSRIYGIPDETTGKLTDPTALVTHFSKEIEAGMHEMGYSIDWKRKFYSFDRHFNRFIEWQFKKLKDLGYIIQGEHPISWCPADKQAVGAHDTKGDVDPELKEFIWIKFHLRGSDLILMTGTTRPDALLGQTNLWVDPNSSYKIVQVKNEKWVVGKEALEKIHAQYDTGAKEIGEIKASELIGKWAKGPIVDYDLYILPAGFIDSSVGSGLVYSALEDPVDLYELRKIQTHNSVVRQYNLDQKTVAKLKPIFIINVEGMGENLGDSIGKEFGVTSAEQKEKLEEAKGELNRRVYRKGIMNKNCGKYAGMTVPQCQDLIKEEMVKEKDAVMFWEMNNKPVYCRCGAEVVATVLKNQWFIDYGNEKWKEKAKQCLAGMNIVPEKTRSDYLATIDWLRQKACARASGLGTKFPFDKKLMIEALSDSTIYIAFYCISHIANEMNDEELNEEFFDYVFLGKEPKAKPGTRDHKTRPKNWDAAREQFTYWYGEDSYHSGADLVRNHLPFHIFNHVAIFEKKFWPQQFVTNGFVLMDGKKMSKSMGNILPLRKAVKEYGADVIRFSVVSGADLTQDTDFNKSVAEGTRSRLEFIAKLVMEMTENKTQDLGHKTSRQIDRWLLSRMNKKIMKAAELYEKMAMRELALEIFYDVYNDLQWYLKRSSGKHSNEIREFIKSWCILIEPFMPHVAEEFWQKLKAKGDKWEFPKEDKKQIDDKAEKGEDLIRQTAEDAANISRLLGKKPERIYIYIASEWKRELYEIIRKEKAFDKVMKATAQDTRLRTHMADVQRITKQLIKNAFSLPGIGSEKWEHETLKDAKEFLERELDCRIEVMKDDGAKHERARNALPGKPAIVLE